MGFRQLSALIAESDRYQTNELAHELHTVVTQLGETLTLLSKIVSGLEVVLTQSSKDVCIAHVLIETMHFMCLQMLKELEIKKVLSNALLEENSGQKQMLYLSCWLQQPFYQEDLRLRLEQEMLALEQGS